jgi:23S rRNA (cytosine1962-C5)-methyltransferase
VSAIRKGHPWVFREQFRSGLNELVPGSEATLLGPDGAPCGRALVDPGSALAARVWSVDPSARLTALLPERLGRAMALRATILDPTTTAYRWVHGEGDRMPGVVVDRYAHVAVLRLDGEAIATWTDRLADLLFELAAPRGVRSIALRSTIRGSESKLVTLRGEDPPEVVAVEEHGMPFLVDLAHGQKTGAFLDQRDNRRRIRGLAHGRRVLNLFSYAGGFSLAAALGGASAVTSVDVAASAHVTAQASFGHANVSLDDHRFVTADVFRFLEQARARGERWDLVISDPPNMAPNEATRPRALAAYRRLHGLCASVLEDSGMFFAASCSSHVGLDEFLATLGDDALGRGDLRILEIAGAGPDHPVLPGFPEGRYLKACLLG